MVRQQIFFNIKPLAQVELLFISSLLTLIYLVKVKPFDNREMNAGEIFNNGILYVMSLQMVLFTKSEDPQEMDGIYLTGEQATNASLAFQIVLLSFTYINLAYLVFDQLSVIPQFFDSKF